MIVCVGLATRDTIYAVPRHPEPDGRVVATERVVAGGGPAATAAVAVARLGVDVVRIPGRMGESTILVGDGTRTIIAEQPAFFELPSGTLDGAEWLHVDHVGYHALQDRRAGIPG